MSVTLYVPSNSALERYKNTAGWDQFAAYKVIGAPDDENIDIIVNGNMEGTEVVNFFSKEAPSVDIRPSKIVDGAGLYGSRGIIVQSADNLKTDWDTEFWVRLPIVLPAGAKFTFSFDYKSDVNGEVDTQCHNEPGEYVHWYCFGGLNFTSTWQHFEKEIIVPNECNGSISSTLVYYNEFRSIAFNLSKNEKATKFYFDNIKLTIDKSVYETGVMNVNMTSKIIDGSVYSLSGQRLSAPKKGINIIGGKKVVIR